MLLVEHESLLTCISHMLRTIGYKVLPVSNLKAALDLAADRQQQIDVLMIDIMLPQLNDHRFHLQIKALRPDVKILYSGFSPYHLEQFDIESSGMNFIRKPYAIAELQETLATLLTCTALPV